jgi:hypothetical protein
MKLAERLRHPAASERQESEALTEALKAVSAVLIEGAGGSSAILTVGLGVAQPRSATSQDQLGQQNIWGFARCRVRVMRHG